MQVGCAFAVGISYSVNLPSVVMRPILLPPPALSCDSVNQRAPSLPRAIDEGPAWGLDKGYSVVAPDWSIRPILATDDSVNHIAPSGPATMAAGIESLDGVVKVLNVGRVALPRLFG